MKNTIKTVLLLTLLSVMTNNSLVLMAKTKPLAEQDISNTLINPPEHGFLSNLQATKWEESMITGNGTFGALVLGYPIKEQIILCHEKLFMPDNPPTKAPDFGSSLKKIRELVLTGQGDKAALLCVEIGKEAGIGGMIWTDPFIPACRLDIESLENEPVLNYNRSVNYETGEAITAWTTKKGKFIRKLFASKTDDVIAMKLICPDDAETNFRLRLSQLPFKNENQRNNSINKIKITTSVSKKGLLKYTARFNKKWDGSLKGYCLEVHLKGCDGKLSTKGDWLYIEGCSKLNLFSNISLSYDLPVSTETKLTDLKETNYDKLLQRHARIQSEMFNRYSLSLGADKSVNRTPSQLINNSSFGKLDNRLVEKLCEASRYILICSTGQLPPNLQGIWGGTWRPAWSSDFTHNGNVQSALASGLNTNFQEVIEAYADYMCSMTDDFRDNANDIYGAPGIFVPSRSSSSGKTYHYSSWHPHLFWFAGGAWTSQLFYDYWQYTGDERFLKEKAIPFMLASAEFLEFMLTEDKNGQLMLVPTYSPEIRPVGGHHMSINSTMDIAALKQLLRNLLRLAELGLLESNKTDQWRRILSRLPAYAIDDSGDLKEWIWPGLKNNNRHRHASHLYPLFYEVDPEFKDNADLMKAAATAIENRLKYRREKNGAEMAFGLVQKGLAASHIGDTEHAYECVDWLCNSYWSPALTPYTNPGEIFNVDICGGLPSLVTEMIIQSSHDQIDLLPTLPEQWSKGQIKGVMTRCGVIIDLEWNESKPVKARLAAKRNTSFKFRFQDQTWKFSIMKGQVQSWKPIPKGKNY